MLYSFWFGFVSAYVKFFPTTKAEAVKRHLIISINVRGNIIHLGEYQYKSINESPFYHM